MKFEQSGSKNDTPNLSRRGFLFGRSPAAEEPAMVEKVLDDMNQPTEVSFQEQVPKKEEKLSRREVLKQSAQGAAIGTVGVTGVIKTWQETESFLSDIGGVDGLKLIREGVTDGRLARYVAERQEESTKREALEKKLEILKQQFQTMHAIPLVFEENPHYKRSDREQVYSSEAHLTSKIKAITDLMGAFRRYPDFLIKSLHIPSVTVRNNLKLSSGSVDGFAIHDDHSISLDVNDDLWRSLKSQERNVIPEYVVHHELFHLFDSLFKEKNDQKITVVDWMTLTPNATIAYRGDDWEIRDFDGDHPPGFAREYGRKNVYEDRATIFELMMTGVSLKVLQEDPILLAKVESINKEVFLYSYGVMSFSFSHYGSYRSWEYEQRMKKIVEKDRQSMALEDPLFDTVSDEQYRVWQQYHQSQLGKR